MTDDRWNILIRKVAAAMTEHIRLFLTPITVEVEQDWGELVGSGSYIQSGDDVFVITNKHVIDEFRGRRGAHHFRESVDENTTSVAVALKRPFALLTSPADVAVARIPRIAWEKEHRESLAIAETRFSATHTPVDRELFFFAGYPQGKSKSLYTSLVAGVTPYTAQQPEPKPSFDFPDYDFHLLYPMRLIESVGGKVPDAPLPPGFSGSLVWNTRFVETTAAGNDWAPENALVTGILRRWIEREKTLVATRVEQMRINNLCFAASGA